MMRRWHFLLSTPVDEEQKARLAARIREALRGWHAHGRLVAYEIAFPYDHFVEITALSPVSGCAADHLFRVILPLLSPLPTHLIATIQDEKIKIESFYEIIKLKDKGKWRSEWRVVEVVEGELIERRLEESGLAVHL